MGSLRRARQWMSLALSSVLILCMLLPGAVPSASGETIARCGKGWLEEINGQRVLHLEGSPREMGYQHGALLKAHCRANLDYLVVQKARELIQLGPIKVSPRGAIDMIVRIQRKHIPQRFHEELLGMAEGSGVPLEDLVAGNFIPELFHCSGFAVKGSATTDGTLYHGRVLDYACDWKLQEHAVVIVAKPDGGIPFVNIGYAGFIGSVSGMNAQHISIGEMGGRGLGHWDGVPMAILMRKVLQESRSLKDAISVFQDNPRTCEYYYVIADGNSNEAVGMEATWKSVSTVRPGQTHPRLPHAVPDAVLLSADQRYETLVDRVRKGHGSIQVEQAIRLMDRPLAMNSNLHNVLFEPASTKFWVANAAKDGMPAAEQPYYAYQLTELLQRQPDPQAVEIPCPVAPDGQPGEKPTASNAAVLPASHPTSPAEVNVPLSDKSDKETLPTAQTLPAVVESPAVTNTLRFCPGATESDVPKPFRMAAHQFESTEQEIGRWLNTVVVRDVRFPSPITTEDEVNNTVHCEYFVPQGQGKRPGVVVLHILGGDFELSRMMCRTLALSGTGALFVKMPYYGPRRNPESKRRMVSPNPELFVSGMTQAVLDIRRAATWLESQEEIDPNRLGITGISLGGIVAALAASVDLRFERTCLMLSGGDLGRIVMESEELKKERDRWDGPQLSLDAVREITQSVDPLTYADRLKGRTVLMMNARKDRVIPPACTRALWEKAGKPEIEWWNVDHYSAIIRLPHALFRTAAFFRESRPTPPAEPMKDPSPNDTPGKRNPRWTGSSVR